MSTPDLPPEPAPVAAFAAMLALPERDQHQVITGLLEALGFLACGLFKAGVVSPAAASEAMNACMLTQMREASPDPMGRAMAAAYVQSIAETWRGMQERQAGTEPLQ